MLSARARIAIVERKAALRYGTAIEENAVLLEQLIALMRVIDYVPKRTIWPERVIAYLFHRQAGICDGCGVKVWI
jgi:hypothetical protein